MRVVRKWIHLSSDYIANGEFFGQLKHNQLVMKCSSAWSYSIAKSPSLARKYLVHGAKFWYDDISSQLNCKNYPTRINRGPFRSKRNFSLCFVAQLYLRRPCKHLSVYTTAYLLRIISSSFVTNLLTDTR